MSNVERWVRWVVVDVGWWLVGGGVVLFVFCAFVALFALLLQNPLPTVARQHPLFFCGKWQQRNLRLLVNAAAATIKKEATRVKERPGGGLRGKRQRSQHPYPLPRYHQHHSPARLSFIATACARGKRKMSDGAIVKAGNSLI